MSLTSKEKTNVNTMVLEIAIPADELKAATDKVFRRRQKTLSVPGFRKGKAPRQIIEKMYGEGIFLEDAVNDLYPAAYESAVEEAGIEPVDRADIEVLSLDLEAGVEFKATVTVKPEMSIDGYKGVAADKTIYTVTDEDIEAEIQRMRERGARIVTITDRAAQNGDDAMVDFEGFVDGVAFDGGKGEDHKLTLGSGSFIDTFEQQIEGHMTGDAFDVNVTFPTEYHVDELAGKPALFKVTLKEIKGKELAELDDEFAKDVSEFDTLVELRADIRAKMQESRDNRAQEEVENALIDVIIEKLEGEIPECMYEQKIDDMMRDFEYRLSSQGMNMELYMQYTGMNAENMRKSFMEQAQRQVKTRLALEKVAELENIAVSDEDIDAEYEKMAENFKMEAEKIKGLVKAKDVAADLKSQRAIDLIRDSAVITEKAEEKAADTEAAEKPAKKSAAKKTAKDDKKDDSEA